MTNYVSLAVIVAIIATTYYRDKIKPDQMKFIIPTLILMLLFGGSMSRSNTSSVEGFTDDLDNPVRFGDIVCLWTWNNSFVRMNNDGRIDLSSRLGRPEEIPRTGWVWEYFILEDARESGAGYNNNNPVKYGDRIILRSTYKNAYVAIHPSRTYNSLVTSTNRDAQTHFQLLNADAEANRGAVVKYGDNLYLKSNRDTYVNVARQSIMGLTSKPDETTRFMITDRYGQGNQIDWARRGTATQSSNYGNYPANNAIDGNLTSFNHTQSQAGAWWQVTLPRDVYIDQIYIGNRRDCCKERLRDFDVIIYDSQSKRIGSKYYAIAGDGVTWDNVGQVGRTVRIQLRGTGFVHLSEVKVYGKPSGLNLLADKELSADVVTEPTSYLPERRTRTVIASTSLPYNRTSKSMSVAMLIKLEQTPTVESLIVHRGASDQERNPAITVMPKTSRLRIYYDTEQKTGNVYDVPTQLPVGQWAHVAVVFDGGINSKNSWITGGFPTRIAQNPFEPCCYYINPLTRQFYQLDRNNAPPEVRNNVIDPAVISDFKYAGKLAQSATLPSMSVYINGQMRHKITIPDVVKTTMGPIAVGSSPYMSLPNAKFTADQVKYYNYALTPTQISKLSLMPINNVVKTLISKPYNASREATFEDNQLPVIENALTYSFWINHTRPAKGTGRWQVIFLKGSNEQRAPGMWLHPTNNHLHMPIRTRNAAHTWGEGITNSQQPVPGEEWHHITLTIQGRLQTLYVDGQQTNQVTLSDDPVYNSGPLRIGGSGFKGQIADFRVANYAMKDSEIRQLMGIHPEEQYNETIRTIWREMGCLNDPVPRDKPNNYPQWRNLIKAGQITAVEGAIRDLKNRADQGDRSAQEECYGAFTAGMLQKLSEKDQLIKYTVQKQSQGVKCLPIAPFSCPKPSESATQQIENLKRELEESRAMAGKINTLKVELEKQPELQANLDKVRRELAERQAKMAEMERLLQINRDELVKNPEYMRMMAEYEVRRKQGQSDLVTNLDLSQLQNNPVFIKTLDELKRNAMRIEDHPDYNRFAEQLRRQGRQEAVKCWDCQLPNRVKN